MLTQEQSKMKIPDLKEEKLDATAAYHFIPKVI